MLTREQKLDEVLKFILKNNNSVTYRDFDSLVGNDVTPEDLDSLLRELMSEPKRYVYFYATQPQTYYVEESGKMFLSKGGYEGQDKREKRNTELTERTYLLVIISVVIALLSLLYQFFCSK
jgi:hypothetical protein